MRNIRLTVQYEGSRYRGWQRLGDSDNTIQGKLEALLSRVCDEAVAVIGSGRTDAGAHALGQVANFHTGSALSCGELLDALAAFLPEDIAVIRVEEAAERFHARYNALAKTYRYRLDCGKVGDVFRRREVHRHPGPLDTEAMRRAAAHCLGEHDFRSFTNGKYKNKSTVRVLSDVGVVREGPFVDLVFTGNGFLYNMVRILAGTLVAVGEGNTPAGALPEILAAKSRDASGEMLPAQGLTLLSVRYQNSGA